YVALGRLCQQVEWFDDGIKAYLNALKLDRENLVAIRGLADCHLRKGDKIEAIKKYKLFRGLKPGDKDVQAIIEQLDAELNPPRQKPAPRVETWPSIAIANVKPPETVLESAPHSRASAELPRPHTADLPDSTNPIAVPALAHAAPPPPEAPAAPERDVTTGPVHQEEKLEGDHADKHEEKYHATDVLELTFDGRSAKRSAKPIPPSMPIEPRPLGSGQSPLEALAMVPPPTPPAVVEPVPVFEEMPPVSTPMPEAPAIEALPAPEASPEAMEGLADSFSAPPPSPPPPMAPEPEPLARAASPPFVEEPFEEATIPPVGAEAVSVSETLAELYLAQGHKEEARQTYESLAESQPSRADELLAKAREVVEPPRLQKLRALARGASPHAVEIGDMHAVLLELVERAPGIPAAVLTDLEGLPVVHAGEGFGSSTMETLIAELTAFWKGLGRSREELGAGNARCLTLRGENGGALVKSVSDEYSLILHLDAGASVGRIAFEAGRAARLVKPALG
ncbi:MAG TPA: roadblock/LC7 domain-containing protein, partial [Thermoanaerobaculia bacterium]|nr:roadblock/LC7 domain-containing protein [Thermoanaerobaculia bacterium]